MNTTVHLRRLFTAGVGLAVAAVTFVWLLADPAAAADVTERALTIPPIWLPILAGFTTSAATSLATRIDARPWVKALVGILFVAAAAVVENIVSHDGLVTADLLDVFAVTFAAHLLAYFGVLMPARVPSALAPQSGVK